LNLGVAVEAEQRELLLMLRSRLAPSQVVGSATPWPDSPLGNLQLVAAGRRTRERELGPTAVIRTTGWCPG
jgi:hypothetical protein